jgi:O-methyltransferase
MNTPDEMYINLLKNVLTDSHRIEMGEYMPLKKTTSLSRFKILRRLDKMLEKMGFAICKEVVFDKKNRLTGTDWPANADTMIGLKRLENIEYCVRDVIANGVAGDLIETGVWRGGATIFMKAILQSLNINNRIVWVADSFEGLPKPDENKYQADKSDRHHMWKELAIPLETVKYNFEKYGLLDENVKFLKGWFKDTLPTAPVSKIAVLRLDGDMYESTIDALTHLYPKLEVGGYLIVDDYGGIKACKAAVEDYRKQHNITEEIKTVDWTGIYWKREQKN